MYYFHSIISAVLLALAFPKTSWWCLAWFALVPFIITILSSQRLKQVIGQSLIFGLVFFGINLFWLNTLMRFASIWAVAAWLALIVFQSLFIVFFGFLVFRFFRSSFLRPFWLAAIWTLGEGLRAWGPFAVASGDLGYSQVSFLPLIQIANLFSIYGVSFLIIFFNAAIAEIYLGTEKRKAHKFIMLAILLVALTVIYGQAQLTKSAMPAQKAITISLIQPNVDQLAKMQVGNVPSIFSLHQELTRQASGEIIIWPETAIFTYLLRDQYYFSKMVQLAREKKAWLIVGTPHFESDKIFNSIAVFSPSGEVVGRYDKRHLVPFGEYLPFRPLLYPLLKSVGYYESNFTPGEIPPKLSVAGLNIGVAICFESTLPNLISESVKKDTSFVLTVTNDSWFNDSAAPYAHLDCGIMRAVENRCYFIQVGNTGLTALIDPFGRVVNKLPLNSCQILTFQIPLR